MSLGGKHPPHCTERRVIQSWCNPEQGPGRAQRGAGAVAGCAVAGTFTTTCWSPGGQQRWQCHLGMRDLGMKATRGQVPAAALQQQSPRQSPAVLRSVPRLVQGHALAAQQLLVSNHRYIPHRGPRSVSLSCKPASPGYATALLSTPLPFLCHLQGWLQTGALNIR